MEQPKKQILYKPPTQIKTGKSDEGVTRANTTKPEPKPPIQKKKTDNQGEKLAQWLKNATLINKNALCAESGVDRGNIDKFLLKGVIPEQHAEKLIKILKKYGYAE